MLAQLDRLEGVAESRVNWSGRQILIRLQPGASPDGVAASAIAYLGSRAGRAAPPAEAASVASFRAGDPWMRAGETLKLSKHEASVLGKHYTALVRDLLDAEGQSRLASLLADEIYAVFERVHAGEIRLNDAMRLESGAALDRIHARLREFAPEEQARAVVEALRSAVKDAE